ncbi:MAG: ligand-binding sensor domain-containing protein, partial [Chitinophagales bacterium]
SLWSQNGDAPRMYFDHLTIQEGLSHNTVHCLLQDQYGYIWIGTQNGLNKYDGYDFEVYRSNDESKPSNGFVGKIISSLYEDREGNLWVGTRKHGINLRRNLQGRFSNHQSDSAFAAIRGHEISNFFEDKAGNIWISSVGGGVLKYNLNTQQSEHFNRAKNKLYSDFAFDVIEDNKGRIWVATAGAGLNLLKEDGQFTLVNVNLPNAPNMDSYRKTLYLDSEFLWVGTEGTGLYRMNLEDQSFVHFPKGKGEKNVNSNGIRDMHRAEDRRLFIATDGGGLNIYNPTTDQITQHTYNANNNTALNSNALLCFLEDQTGNIWIGTYNGGINILKANKTRFEVFRPVLGQGEDLAHRSILSLHQSQDGKIWVGTDGGGFSWFNPKDHHFSNSFFTYNPSKPQFIGGNVVKTIFEDSQDRLWLGVFAQPCNIYNPKTETFQVFDPQNQPYFSVGASAWSIAEQKDGTIWIGTIGDGLQIINPITQKVIVFGSNEENMRGLAQKNIIVVFVDKDDQVWVGTADKGLNLWKSDEQRFSHFKHDASDSLSLSDNEIRAIFQDNTGTIWIGTEGGGLNRWLGGGKFEHITKEDGLIANSVMGITEDRDGLIWVSTFEGISRLNPTTNTTHNFDFHRGQNHNQFNQMAILTAEDGRLFFGGINGLNAIYPNQVVEDDADFDILFTDFKIFNESVPIGKLPNRPTILEQPIEVTERVNLQYYDNSFSIDFAVMDYTNSLENTFEYKMEGFDEKWRTVAVSQHSASYTNLDPDSYTFKVRHRGNESSIEVYIAPPFWERWWFKILTFLLLVGLAYMS